MSTFLFLQVAPRCVLSRGLLGLKYTKYNILIVCLFQVLPVCIFGGTCCTARSRSAAAVGFLWSGKFDRAMSFITRVHSGA